MNLPLKDTTTVTVGLRMRSLREERAISLRELARRSGLSANALSMIERGLTSPSLSTLAKLASALQVPITTLFREEKVRHDIVFTRAEDRQQEPFFHGLWEGLGGDSFSGRMEAFLLTLESSGSSGSDGILHTGHEFVYCLKGAIEYQVGQQTFIMHPGDSLLFAAQMVHRWKNVSSEEAKAVIVLAGFEETEHPGEFHLNKSV